VVNKNQSINLYARQDLDDASRYAKSGIKIANQITGYLLHAIYDSRDLKLYTMANPIRIELLVLHIYIFQKTNHQEIAEVCVSCQFIHPRNITTNPFRFTRGEFPYQP